MAKSDRRVKYTKHALHSAVLTLLETKPIDALTIKEICELADVNRGTFYLHYTEPMDVLKEIENDFIDEHMAIFDVYWEKERDLGVLARLYTCIMENQKLMRILLGEHGDPQFARRLESLCREGILDGWQKEFPAYRRENLDFLFDFVFQGSMRLLLTWIDDGRGLDAAQFASRLERLGHYCLLSVAEFC